MATEGNTAPLPAPVIPLVSTNLELEGRRSCLPPTDALLDKILEAGLLGLFEDIRNMSWEWTRVVP